MTLPPAYVDELNLLNREVTTKQPTDILRFCADYFNERLAKREEADDDGPRSKPLGGGFREPGFGSSSRSTDGSLFRSSFADTSSEGPGSASSEPAAPFTRRTSVSAESIAPGAFAGAASGVASNNLSAEQLESLYKSVSHNFLFGNLDEEACRSVLQSLQEKKCDSGEKIITQGDEGDYFYIVESGAVEFIKDGVKVNSSGPGSSFGELALMYNAPRAATVVATQPCVLWSLDRVTFRKILLDGTHQRRSMYDGFLKEVPILSDLGSYERNKLADALTSQVVEPGTAVITEGEAGDAFYLVESGEAEVTKKGESGVVATLKQGDYFGEVALLNDLPRQATVTAKTKLKVATLGKDGFQRLLGPVLDHLKENDPTK
ncbi:YALI0F04422p [Yarrowia lipolytica CLIB122]|uniref:cAMP-dependent protein kinase regulatory subunit n=1 Tax=Yarrowia lipolytica (strain CLIB 122 / E 150) TaxID=284591 RepID=KAPR_YARLI|nr:YALI0F04422p [Yarrowia lipolytica CLIB122]Q6C2X0.1 RecName: Full=cAMP-dependent protein kinase regulatory subunit; Short=PKA regulatory subunit [Yarrowia lipolytica CLIB122]QNQ01357.1 cAMP-dependent protein kinase regulatory subunit [Yarrowia lipolytica]CAG77799.1 YALI0F04422p [Yarrowia lipolytica CLIB122]VBB83335.1 Regulatory subunit of the cyclic AMP-dependent protein kinase (PKA), putative [Yarrowia lipolytica]|eukprot:XP_504992.1 YALI0F04422p [Yarrowia lipolytica CLIB122]